MSEPIPVKGLFETHLTVGNLERSIAFYRDVVGLPLALDMPERGAAFFWIGRPGEAMLGLWTTGSAPIGLSLHVAFATSLEGVLAAGDRLKALGVTPLSFSAEEASEPSVIGWMPAAAVYFRDPDGHLLEYLAMLDGEPDPERRVTTWSDWNANRGRRGAHGMSVVERIRDALPDEATADADVVANPNARGVLVSPDQSARTAFASSRSAASTKSCAPAPRSNGYAPPASSDSTTDGMPAAASADWAASASLRVG